MASIAPPPALAAGAGAAWREFARDFFTSLDAEPTPLQRLRTAARLKLAILIPALYAPTAYWVAHAAAVFPQKASARSPSIVWYAFAIVFLVANVAIVGSKRAPENARAARLLTQVSIASEAAGAAALDQAIGTATSYLPILFVLMIAAYRVFFDYALALWATLVPFCAFTTLAALEIFGVLDPNPYFAGLHHPLSTSTPATLVVIETVDATLLITFFTVNYGVNQAVKLHRYITESVLRRYLPERLVERAARGELRLDAPPERRIVTVMYTDLVGFTALSEELGPLAVGAIIDRYLSRVAELAHEHGATVDKFIGDCVMIVFGAPDALEPAEQARRSVELALAIQAGIRSIDAAVPLSARTGINTGEAVVGNFGCEWRSDYTVIGPAVNVAARLEAAGQAGRILLGEETAKLLGDAYELTPVGELKLKNVSRPVRAFLVRDDAAKN
ncbi:MAG TPA: adenylate/guanylate cyclase domain-containing protein [Polyangiaceae bacterium]|nr:adenylate/guanylate cyclase domain-containing protein [Polyangiaceae bacterium]